MDKQPPLLVQNQNGEANESFGFNLISVREITQEENELSEIISKVFNNDLNNKPILMSDLKHGWHSDEENLKEVQNLFMKTFYSNIGYFINNIHDPASNQTVQTLKNHNFRKIFLPQVINVISEKIQKDQNHKNDDLFVVIVPEIARIDASNELGYAYAIRFKLYTSYQYKLLPYRDAAAKWQIPNSPQKLVSQVYADCPRIYLENFNFFKLFLLQHNISHRGIIDGIVKNV